MIPLPSHCKYAHAFKLPNARSCIPPQGTLVNCSLVAGTEEERHAEKLQTMKRLGVASGTRAVSSAHTSWRRLTANLGMTADVPEYVFWKNCVYKRLQPWEQMPEVRNDA